MQVHINAIAVVPPRHSGPGDRLGFGMYPRAAMMNHSCAPNVHLQFCGACLHARALLDLAPGAVLRICYGPQVLNLPSATGLHVLFGAVG